MQNNTPPLIWPRRRWMLAALAAGAGTLGGCALFSDAEQEQHAKDAGAEQDKQGPYVTNVEEPEEWSSTSGKSSTALTAKAYRRDAASYLYSLNANRIYHGKLPPFLYAVGVLDVTVDRFGRVQATQWARAPQHAPEVMAEIVRTIRQASPLPAPVLLGNVVYTDTWLWDKSGKFQLDTLSEGQLGHL